MSFLTILKSMRRIFVIALISATLLTCFPTVHGLAQEEGIERKIKVKVDPAYPEIARRMKLTGVVKLEVIVAANGSVKDTKVVGGHPILISAAVDAVKRWKFEAGSSDTKGTVEFKFEP